MRNHLQIQINSEDDEAYYRCEAEVTGGQTLAAEAFIDVKNSRNWKFFSAHLVQNLLPEIPKFFANSYKLIFILFHFNSGIISSIQFHFFKSFADFLIKFDECE